MKTRNILLLIGLLLCASSAAAQTRFFDVTRTFHESGFTYQADVTFGAVVLYNRNAGRFVNIQQMHRDGRGIRDADRDRYDDVVESTRMRLLAHYLVRNAFSAAERGRLREGERLSLILIICPDTGNVKEVHFRFFSEHGYATIPVSTWRRIELDIKREVRFTPTAFGRSMNFIFRGWQMDVAQMIREHGTTPPPPTPPPGGNPGGGICWIDDDDPPIGPIGPMRGEDPLEEEEETLEETELLELK